jgi:hypothetical protein
MLLLNKACGNCYKYGIKECVLVEVLLPDYSKLD